MQVGQLGNALEELIETQNPDRIIIETSGSAYPAPLAWELRKYEPKIHLDGIVTVRASHCSLLSKHCETLQAREQCLAREQSRQRGRESSTLTLRAEPAFATEICAKALNGSHTTRFLRVAFDGLSIGSPIAQVIDAVNFKGYDDKSYTAKEQCKYTDLILINKHELVPDERTLDTVLDDVHELNPETPKVRTIGPKGAVSADLVFGLDTKLFKDAGEVQLAMSQHEHDSRHQALEVDLLQVGANHPMNN
eukprot:4904302-Pyramimonas_sp.AAC.1